MNVNVVYYGIRDFVSDAVKAELAECERAKFVVVEVKGLSADFKFCRPHKTIKDDRGEVLFVALASSADANFFALIFAHHVVDVDPFVVLHELFQLAA